MERCRGIGNVTLEIWPSRSIKVIVTTQQVRKRAWLEFEQPTVNQSERTQQQKGKAYFKRLLNFQSSPCSFKPVAQ